MAGDDQPIEEPQPENEPVETPAPEPESRAEERIRELSREVADARRLLNEAQRQQQEFIARQAMPSPQGRNPIQGWNPEWEQNPGMVALRESLAQRDQQIAGLQQTTLAAVNTLDKVQAPLELEDQYENGRALYRKLEGAVEQEFNQALQSGRPQSRKDLFPLVAARHGVQLRPRGDEPEEPRKPQRRSVQTATTETAAPPRKVNSSPPAKSMHDMTPAERKEHLRRYVEDRQTQGLPL